MAKTKHDLNEETTYVSKKCPHCFTYMPLKVLTCPACNEKVGPVDKYGMASKTPDYRSYFISFVAFIGLIIFLYYAFFKEG
jgi:hypothetical protein